MLYASIELVLLVSEQSRYVHLAYLALAVMHSVKGNFVSSVVIAVVQVCASVYRVYVLR